MFLEYIAQGSESEPETELEQLTVDFVKPPAGILFCQLHNERFQL